MPYGVIETEETPIVIVGPTERRVKVAAARVLVNYYNEYPGIASEKLGTDGPPEVDLTDPDHVEAFLKIVYEVHSDYDDPWFSYLGEDVVVA